MHSMGRRITALTAVAILGLTGAACSDDEDGDGDGTDEEIGDLGEDIEGGVDGAGDETEEQIDEGAEESEESE